MSAPNAELAYRILDHIDAHPDAWNQARWACGTSACFAGWAVRLSGGIIDGLGNSDAEVVDGPEQLVGQSVEEAAYEVLGIDEHLAGWTRDDVTSWLFHDGNTREDLGRLVAEIFGPRPEPTA